MIVDTTRFTVGSSLPFEMDRNQVFIEKQCNDTRRSRNDEKRREIEKEKRRERGGNKFKRKNFVFAPRR